MNKISIRNSKYAISGLQDMIAYINEHSKNKENDFLYSGTDYMTMVEIGSYVGDSTKVFATNFNQVISIDPYVNGYDNKDTSSFLYPMEEIYLQFQENVLNIYSNVHHFRMTSEAASKRFEKAELAFVYLDGDHRGEAVKKDIELWLPKIIKGGWIGGHDYNNIKNAPEVKAAVDKYFIPDQTFKDTSWIKQLL